MSPSHTPLVLRLLRKKDKTQKDGALSLSDSDSQMTLVSRRSYKYTRDAPRTREQQYNGTYATRRAKYELC
ncbi:uncharacterized protein ACLA_092870 [Aspergillus clavatus NRRL 1]|uniref:Uncharacterized protein n=1 Tax=Aspergillus clavatus (strain ATCC 1007 / CBS 513.65 / DSM 816 / NCTC 3887 / NRRL 1 / QM 1276 / 107) TaxID=344612 RepID=A1CFE0_ASPCL|nr:uncharacterized protein ACLA_092870 [Aspergillus clavatus NRRL 1]EAW11589.1 hypothetical protein ACLA_092870 [Aspergillus clavatus NRRL 1]